MLSPGFAHQLLHALQQTTSSNGLLEEIAALAPLPVALCVALLSALYWGLLLQMIGWDMQVRL